MVDPTPIAPALPKMTELQRSRYDLLQQQMLTLQAQASAAELQITNCQLLAAELQRKMDALMGEVRATLADEADSGTTDRDAA